MRRVARNTLPVISSQGIFQVSSLVDLALASLAGTSALAALGYSQRLLYLPISLFGISVAAAALPAMSRETASAALRERLVNGFFQITFFVLPAAVILLLFGDLAVGVIYERGEFTRESTLLVSSVLSAYSLGLVAMSSMKLFASGFHALQDTATPMRIAAISVTVGVVVSISLTLAMRAAGYGPYSAVGLSLGGATGAWLNLLLHWWLLSRRIGGLFDKAMLMATIRLCLAVLVAAFTASITRTYLEPGLADGSFLGRVMLLGSVLTAGGIPYLLIARRPPRLAGSSPSND
jgi:putative peptidoglycan lipid II flippase